MTRPPHGSNRLSASSYQSPSVETDGFIPFPSENNNVSSHNNNRPHPQPGHQGRVLTEVDDFIITLGLRILISILLQEGECLVLGGGTDKDRIRASVARQVAGAIRLD